MLDIDMNRKDVPVKDAATLVLVRGAAAGGGIGSGDGIEIFCVQRNQKSAFMGGAIVFPGGKIDPADKGDEWAELATPPRPTRAPIADDPAMLRAILVAACRESLEEAAILPLAKTETVAAITHEELLTMRARAASGEAIGALLRERGSKLDLGALRVFARWITPAVENRRFDTRFVMVAAPEGQPGAHDERETISSFWTTPAAVLARFDAGEVQLAPPTHRILSLLCECKDVAAALAWSDRQNLAPILPRIVPQADTMALTLPGDPEHDVPDVRVEGTSRFVLRGERWLPESPPVR